MNSGVTVNEKTKVFGDLKSGDLVVCNATDPIRAGTAFEAHEE
jgi:hypothetical protein